MVFVYINLRAYSHTHSHPLTTHTHARTHAHTHTHTQHTHTHLPYDVVSTAPFMPDEVKKQSFPYYPRKLGWINNGNIYSPHKGITALYTLQPSSSNTHTHTHMHTAPFMPDQ